MNTMIGENYMSEGALRDALEGVLDTVGSLTGKTQKRVEETIVANMDKVAELAEKCGDEITTVNGLIGNVATQGADLTAALQRIAVAWGFVETMRLAIEMGTACDVIVFRPFQTYRMSSAILAAGGEDLGSTFHGHHDFQLSDDIIRKVHVGHYTHYSKSVVKQPKRFSLAENVFAQGYVSGEGVEFFSEDDLADQAEHIGHPDLQKSLISWKVSPGSADDLIACDMRGEFQGVLEDYNKTGDQHFEGASLLKAVLQRCGIEGSSEPRDRYLEPGYGHNLICFRGLQYDLVKEKREETNEWRSTGKFVCTSLGHGHWKGLTYSGCMGVREGVMMYPDESRHTQTVGNTL
jgi:hypothetical protein